MDGFLWAAFGFGSGLIIAVALIVVIGQIHKARVSAIGKSSFERLASELKKDNAKIMEELSTMKESVDSINKMMKDIG